MKYIKAEKYNAKNINNLFMGPNPIKLTEELLLNHRIPAGATVMDLGCGRGVTSVFLVKEYGFRVFATDLWISATENKQFFDRMGLTSDRIIPIHADATALPYAEEFFDRLSVLTRTTISDTTRNIWANTLFHLSSTGDTFTFAFQA